MPEHAEGSNLLARTASGAVWSGASTVGRQVLAFVSLALLARLLPPSAYGLLAMASLLSNFLLTFRDLGTAAAVIQKREVSPELLSSVFWVNVILGTFLTLCICAAAYPMAWFFHEPALLRITQAMSLTFAISAPGMVPDALLSRRMAFRQVAVAELSGLAIGYGLAIASAFRGLGRHSRRVTEPSPSATSPSHTATRWPRHPASAKRRVTTAPA
jgi:PST family polysaccharide transporter